MSGVSSIWTGGVLFSADALAPTVTWCIHGCPANQIPDNTPLLIASVVLVVAHAAYNVITARLAKPGAISVETPRENPHA